jgi:hypothetical protein
MDISESAAAPRISSVGGETRMSMNRSVTKDEALQFISVAFRNAESAVRAHPQTTVAIYELGLAAIEHHFTGDRETRIVQMSNSNLSRDERLTIMRYLHIASFMSAWNRLNGNRKLSNQGLLAASGLAVSAGFSLELAMELMLGWEEPIRSMMIQKGIVPPRAFVVGCVLILCAVLVVGGIVWFWTR